MSKTYRNTRRGFYENPSYSRDGSPNSSNYRDINNHGKYGDESANNKRAMNRLIRRKAKRAFLEE